MTGARRPFRAPHHTASAPALVGGGSHPRPGEISLAHNGVLFLDELPEFSQRVLEALREPARDRQHHDLARGAAGGIPGPVPAGGGDESMPVWLSRRSQRGRCRCSEMQIQHYRARISGPLLDRIDLHIEMPRPEASQFRVAAIGERVQWWRGASQRRERCRGIGVKQSMRACRLETCEALHAET